MNWLRKLSTSEVEAFLLVLITLTVAKSSDDLRHLLVEVNKEKRSRRGRASYRR